MKNLFLFFILIFCGCNFQYVGLPDLPKDKNGIESHILFYEKEVEQVNQEIADIDNRIKYAQEYSIKNPDTFWNTTGSNLLKSAYQDKRFALNRKAIYESRLEDSKRKLEMLKENENI